MARSSPTTAMSASKSGTTTNVHLRSVIVKCDTVVTGGLVVTGSSITRADVGIAQGQVIEVGSVEVDSGIELLDATGMLVIPGALDEHVHPIYLDDPGDSSLAAVYGGTTTLMHFAYAPPGTRLVDALDQMLGAAAGRT